MAEVTARRAGEMVRGLFVLLADEPDGLAAKEALARLAKVLPPTPFEAADYPKRPGVRRYKRKVTLIDLGNLYRLWVEHQRTIPEENLSLLPLTPVYYLDRSRCPRPTSRRDHHRK